MKFNYSKIVENNETYVIAEAGSNWKVGSYEQDLSEAKKLIHTAMEAKADAIKFQTFDSNTLYAQNAGVSDYLKKSGIDEDINTMFERLSMPDEMIPELADECKKSGIDFMSSVFSIEAGKKIDPYVAVHKIASYELNHLRLLEFVAKTNKPVIISTGASTIEEIDFAIKTIRKYNQEIIVMQCTACYPTPLENLNLLTIKDFSKKYNLPVGLSDHSIDPIIAPIVAVALGAKIIEKHFTLNRTRDGPDHKFAIEPNELNKMVNMIRMSEKSLGHEKKQVEHIENELKIFAKRSLQTIKKVKKGDIFQEGINFDVLRPGKQTRGLDARFLLNVIGKRSTKDLNVGEGITEYE